MSSLCNTVWRRTSPRSDADMYTVRLLRGPVLRVSVRVQCLPAAPLTSWRRPDRPHSPQCPSPRRPRGARHRPPTRPRLPQWRFRRGACPAQRAQYGQCTAAEARTAVSTPPLRPARSATDGYSTQADMERAASRSVGSRRLPLGSSGLPAAGGEGSWCSQFKQAEWAWNVAATDWCRRVSRGRRRARCAGPAWAPRRACWPVHPYDRLAVCRSTAMLQRAT